MIACKDVTIRFKQGVEAIRQVDFEVQKGEFVALLGPSGCGKSTLLNAIASLLDPEEVKVTGQILIDGQDVHEQTHRELNLGYVAQQDSLLPWQTVLGNVQIGLDIRGVPKSERLARSTQLLEMVGLQGFEHYYPHQVSGGMRKRVMLTRTLAYNPDVILMDEPFGALDAHTRMILQAELLRIWDQARKTIIFVTHDLTEAILVAQRIILLTQRPARIKQIYEINFPYPRDPFELRGLAEFAQIEASIWQALREEFVNGTKTEER